MKLRKRQLRHGSFSQETVPFPSQFPLSLSAAFREAYCAPPHSGPHTFSPPPPRRRLGSEAGVRGLLHAALPHCLLQFLPRTGRSCIPLGLLFATLEEGGAWAFPGSLGLGLARVGAPHVFVE